MLVSVCRLAVHWVPYSPGATDKPTVDSDGDDDEVMSRDEVSELLHQVLSQGTDQLNCSTACDYVMVAAESHVPDELPTVSEDAANTQCENMLGKNDDDASFRSREFAVSPLQFPSRLSSPVGSCHTNLAATRGDSVLMFLLQL